MIRRVSDYDSLQPESLAKLEQIVNAKKEKLIHVAKTQKEAMVVKNELIDKGYLTNIKEQNDNFYIYATEQEKIKLVDRIYPILSKYLLVDMQDYDFARRSDAAQIRRKEEELRKFFGVTPTNN